MPNPRDTAEDRMGRLPKVIAGAFIAFVVLLLLAACVGFYGYLTKPVKAVPFEQRGSAGMVYVTYPAPAPERLKN